MPIDNSSRFPKPLAADLLELSEGMAIVIDGDTASKAITAGQYLFIKNHSTLATGGYHATAAIASGASITSSNTVADPNGIVNALRGTVDALNEAVSSANGNLTPISVPVTSGSAVKSGASFVAYKVGKLLYLNGVGEATGYAKWTNYQIGVLPEDINMIWGGFLSMSNTGTVAFVEVAGRSITFRPLGATLSDGQFRFFGFTLLQ